ncbi:MAG: PAS domain-containing protein [Pirellulales bacterium]|nr:PAS domain-containing protein [Pirellulales bacterium]
MADYPDLAQVLEQLPDGITIQDRDFNIIFQNAAMKEAFGEHVGSKCYEIYEERSKVCEGCGLLKAFDTGKSNLVHRTAVSKGGSISYWENACFPLFNAEGDIVAGVEVCRNITDRVSLTQELRDRSIELGKLNDQLSHNKSALLQRTDELEAAYSELRETHTRLLQQEKLASIGQLAAGIAHEINTPIQFVGDNISFLRESFEELISGLRQFRKECASDANDSTEISELRTRIISVLEHLDFDFLENEIPLALEQAKEGLRGVTDIVLAMKSFSHAGNKELEEVVLDDLIHSTMVISRNAWKYEADFDLELATPPLVVKATRNELGQVLLNLIMNAADAIADKEYPDNQRGRIRIITRRKDNCCEILVEDSGCGIGPDIQKRIFEPFFTTKEVGRGSGQGLSIAYNIITEMHGGELSVESTLGVGSTFIVRLPSIA